MTGVRGTAITVVAVLLCACSTSRIDKRAPVNDGPYLLRQSDSVIVALYVCNDSLLVRRVVGQPDVRFRGLCQDTAVEYVVPAEAFVVAPDTVGSVSRIFAVSDIHGEYELLNDLLTRSQIVDSVDHWNWGTGHLVIVGDVFDRGDNVTECLWLLYRLEQEARQAGGAVHVLLGNHELMVMQGDLRYVNEKYSGGIAKKSKITYEDLFGPDMVLGQWLRSKHASVKLNDLLFVHGGVSTAIVHTSLTLTEINSAVRSGLDLRSSQRVFDSLTKLLYGNDGPLWYRGYHRDVEAQYIPASSGQIDGILGYFGARTIVVGHTEVDSVLGLYDNRVVAIDVPTDELGSLQGLLWEQGALYRVTGSGERRLLK